MSVKNATIIPSADGDLKVTAADIKFFTVLFKYLPRQLDLNWEEFASEMGLKDGSIAKVRLRQIRKKLGLDGIGGNDATSPAKPRPTRPSPSKVTKSRKPKSKVAMSALEAAADAIQNEDVDEEAEDGEI